MPYSPRYIMEQMARGRPIPSGRPEDDLHRAMEQLSPMEMDRALHMGARVDVPDHRGRLSAHIILDAALSAAGDLKVAPERLLHCLRFLVRNGADFNLPHPQTRLSAIGRMAPLAALPMGKQVHHLVGPRIHWQAPVGPGQETARQAWDRHAQAACVANAPRPRVR